MAAVAIVYLGMLFLPLLDALLDRRPEGSAVLSFQRQVTRIYDDRFIFPFRGRRINGPRGRRPHQKKSTEVAGARGTVASGGAVSPALRASQERLSLAGLCSYADPARLAVASRRHSLRPGDLLRKGSAVGRAAETRPAASKHCKTHFSDGHRLHRDHPARPAGGVCEALSHIRPGARAFLVPDFRMGSGAYLR